MDGVFGCDSEGEWCQVPSCFVRFARNEVVYVAACGIAEAGESARLSQYLRYTLMEPNNLRKIRL